MYTVILTDKTGNIRKMTVSNLLDATRIIRIAVQSGKYSEGEITKAKQKLN